MEVFGEGNVLSIVAAALGAGGNGQRALRTNLEFVSPDDFLGMAKGSQGIMPGQCSLAPALQDTGTEG